MREPSEALAQARRSIDGMDGVVDVGQWYFDDRLQRWTLGVRLRHGLATSPTVPAETVWHVVVDDEYPWGQVRFHPAMVEGVTRTHHHQRFNGTHRNGDDRVGQICLTRPDRAIGRSGDDEPYDADQRLAYQVTRALEWLRDAAVGRLAIDDEWFELPDFPGAETSQDTVAFIEDREGLAGWTDQPRFGVATMLRYGSVHLVQSFGSVKNRPFREVDWRGLKALSRGSDLAVWARLDRPPTTAPWHPAAVLGELAEVFAHDDRDLIQEIVDAATAQEAVLRVGRRHLLLVGFPIPQKIGGNVERMHWQALRLPALSTRQEVKGFRARSAGYAQRDRMAILRAHVDLEWIRSENWAHDNITSRGVLPESMTTRRVVVVGAGALGCVIAELLVRAGVRDIVIVDEEKFAAGNATRHTLSLDVVGHNKAFALAQRLSLVRPSVSASAVGRFPRAEAKTRRVLSDARLVVDTTGNDAVIRALETFGWDADAMVVSLSLGYGARRLFAYSSPARSFSCAAFREAVTPWLLKERGEPKSPLPRGGIGCWHPVFPARADDVWLLGAAGVKCIEAACKNASTQLRVFEQSQAADDFIGLRELARTNA